MKLFGYDIRFRRAAGKATRLFSIDVFMPQRERLVFSKSELLDCQRKISDRLANAVFTFEKSDGLSQVCGDIKDFLQRNRLQIIQRLFQDGYIILNTDDLSFSDITGRIVSSSFDGKVRIQLQGNEVVYTSETYKSTGQSDWYFLRDKIRFLDSVNSSDFNLIENYGAMGIVSPESDNSVAGAEFGQEEIEDMQREYRKSYGITVGKWQLMFVPRPVRYTPITMPVGQLQLSEKRLYCIKSLYESFGIPKELSVYFDNATYENRRQAELDMYSNTISKWARVFCEIGMLMYDNIRSRVDFLLPNDMYFDFVGVLALKEEQQKEKQAARDELLFWEEVKARYPQHVETAEKRINDLIETL